LELLNPKTPLVAIAVEGLRTEDERGVPADTWDGVDCSFYFGGNDVRSAKQIVIDQLKYSSANPEKTWTVSRLVKSTNKKGDNSVIARLAKAFARLSKMRPDLVASGDLRLRLVSNQRINPVVTQVLAQLGTSWKHSEQEKKARAELLAASGLRSSDFDAFIRALDFSKCGSRSRFATEERVLLTISSWTEDDARPSLEHLMDFVRRKMMPESRGEVITRESILAQFGVSDPGALFPCPSTIRNVRNLVNREEAQAIADEMLAGKQRLCFHGVGGCGKTTLLQDISMRLPQGSVMLIYDCYGSGRYLDSDAFRHRPPDAFLQLSNELSQRLRTPLLITKFPNLDYPKIFKKRLALASEIVSAKSADALIVVVADAADNSITAAENLSEHSFIPSLLSLGDLPNNVRLVITSRTGRLPTLKLPPTFGTPFEVKGFSQAETALFVRLVWERLSDNWIEDFHYLSGGNPRVQSYALSYGKGDPDRTLGYLLPHGKSLDKIFEEQLTQARNKFGTHLDVRTFCAALVALPRPVPIEVLSVVSNLSSANISDLCADLAPGVRLKDGFISFADEDFEHFLRLEAGEDLSVIDNAIATHLLSVHKVSAYAATHVGTALSKAARGLEVVELIKSGSEPAAIGDPVLRRQVQLERLKLAMKVCREVGNDGDAMLTVLIGADALKTDEAIRNMLIQNPDLTALFARDTSSRMILRDPSQIGNHGSLLFHFMAADSAKGNGIAVREGSRQVRAWLDRRKQEAEGERAKNPESARDPWPVDFYDVAAETEASLRVDGPRAAVSALNRWRPRSIRLSVALSLAPRLVAAGDCELIERCVDEGIVSKPWDLLLLVPLALAGREVRLSSLRSSLATLLRRGLIRVDSLRERWQEENLDADYLETVVTACEILAFRGGDRKGVVVSILERFADPGFRRTDKLHISQGTLIDLSLRAHSLLERFNGRQSSVESFLLEAPQPPEDLRPKEKERVNRSNDETKEELERFIGTFLSLYDERARLLLGLTTARAGKTALEEATSHSRHEDYRMRNDPSLPRMRARAALSLTTLTLIPKLSRESLCESALAVLGSARDPFNSSQARVLRRLALDRTLHKTILTEVTSNAAKIEGARESADEKIDALVRFSRLLLPISKPDAQNLFNRAIAASAELNAEAIHEISLLEPLVERAIESMPADSRRTLANAIATVVGDAWIRLKGAGDFPWQKAARTLCLLDVNIALAVTARWEDFGLVHRSQLLSEILSTALSRESLSPAQVVALMPLLRNVEEELMIPIGRRSSELEASKRDPIIEELAWEELLRFGQGARGSVVAELVKASRTGSGVRLDQLKEAAAFRQAIQSKNSSGIRKPPSVTRPARTKKIRWFEKLDWKKGNFVTPATIAEAAIRVHGRGLKAGEFIPFSVILDRMAKEVQLHERVAHLDALRECESKTISDNEIVDAISQRLEDWGDSPSVAEWARTKSLQIFVEKLPTFVRWLGYYQERIEKWFRKSGAAESEIAASLLASIERHVDTLDARAVYSLVGLVGTYCDPKNAASAVERYAERMVYRIPQTDRDSLEISDIPTEPAIGLARYVYALLSDVDVRIRWRASHVVRSLCRLGEIETVSNILALYPVTEEKSYRRPDAPFYWLASRLWLVIALDRIAVETPKAIGHLGGSLLAKASDTNFPHVLFRAFAKSTLSKLLDNGVMKLTSAERRLLEQINVSSPAATVTSRDSKFYKYHYQGRESRQFTFNSHDTLPNWYSDAVSAFADLDREHFLDVAEDWIVNRWNVKNDPWRWNDEPRRDRLSSSSISSYHRDGSLPTGERFHTYLEWHAMWCAIGQLMQTLPLADLPDDDYESLHRQLAKNSLAEPPLWLADLNGLKPLEPRFWLTPSAETSQWIKTLSDDDFLVELGTHDDDHIVISAYHDERSYGSGSTTLVHSALVNSETALSLVRALQTVPHYADYRLPDDDDRFEIDDPPYELKGWTVEGNHNSGIDEHDPLRFDVAPIQSLPSGEVIAALYLHRAHDGLPIWCETETGDGVIEYRAWSDVRWSDSGERILSSDELHSSGYQLRIHRNALKAYLKSINMDLIVEIQISRGNRGDGHRYHQEDSKELDFDRILLLRQDGTIEATEGRIGTWMPSRPRAGTRR
jgi:hypothetical protein